MFHRTYFLLSIVVVVVVVIIIITIIIIIIINSEIYDNSDLKSSNQCIQACSKASKMLGMIKRTISYKTPEIAINGQAI